MNIEVSRNKLVVIQLYSYNLQFLKTALIFFQKQSQKLFLHDELFSPTYFLARVFLILGQQPHTSAFFYLCRNSLSSSEG